MIETLPHYSYSSLSLMDQCPALFKARRMEHVVEMQTAPLAIGILTHEAINRYLTHLSTHGLPTDKEAIPDLLQHTFATQEDGTTTLYFSEVNKVVRQFANQYVFDADALVDLEGYYTRNLPDGTEIRGYLDMVNVAPDDALVIRDFKTGWASKVDPSYEFQRLVHAWLLAGRYPDRTIRFEFHFVRAKVVSDPYTITPYDFSLVEQRMATIIARHRAALTHDHFPPIPGRHCAFCPISLRCSALERFAKQAAVLTNEDDARAMLEQVVVLDAALDARKSMLKQWVDSAGPVRSNGTSARYVTSESTGIGDVKKFLDALGDGGFEFLAVDGRKAKKLKGDERVSDLWTHKSKTRFTIDAKDVVEDDDAELEA